MDIIDFSDCYRYEPQIDYIWEGFPTGSIACLTGQKGTGKTFWALEAATAVGNGGAEDLLGLGVKKSGGVFYIQSNDLKNILVKRFKSLLNPQNQDSWMKACEQFSLLDVYGHVEPVMITKEKPMRDEQGNIVETQGLNIFEQQQRNMITSICKGGSSNPPKRLVIIDTISQGCNIDFSSSYQVSHFINILQFIAKEANVGILIIDETANQQVIDAARWVGTLTRNDKTSKRTLSGDITLSVSKSNYLSHHLTQNNDIYYSQNENGLLQRCEFLKLINGNVSQRRANANGQPIRTNVRIENLGGSQSQPQQTQTNARPAPANTVQQPRQPAPIQQQMPQATAEDLAKDWKPTAENAIRSPHELLKQKMTTAMQANQG